ncbi:MAG: response regulator transcription factor [Chitinophagales bacterium]|nr:response regulator transcription factor [Chitinophagales bacterium]
MKILAIDDDRIILELIKGRLGKDGYEVLTANNASEAFELLRENPAVILTDVMMPGLTGLEFLSILKNNMLNETPIIVISVLADSETVYRAMNSGANDFVNKPIDFDQLVSKIQKYTLQPGV